MRSRGRGNGPTEPHGRLGSWTIIAALVVVALAVAACQGTVDPTAPAATPSPSGAGSPAPSATGGPTASADTLDLVQSSYIPAPGRNGGRIVIGSPEESNQFHPYYVSQDTDARVVAAAWSSLVAVTADGRFAPDLAASLPTTSNGGVRVPGDGGDAMTVTWQLRPGLAWSDGAPLTCDDVKYAWEWVRDPANIGVSLAGFENITSMDCRSATELVWHFDRVYPSYLTLLPAPLPRHYLSAIPMSDQTVGAGFGDEDLSKLPVSGPFKFESAERGREIRMVRNGNYSSWATGKPAHMDGLTWRWYPDAPAVIAAYRDGAIDVATGLRDVDLPKVKDLGRQASATTSLEYEVVRFNWSPANCSRSSLVAGRGQGCPLSDPAMRTAIALTIDRGDLASRLLGGTVQVADGNIWPGSWFQTAGQAPVARDPNRARAVLDAAGWATGRDGIRVRDGLAARIDLCTMVDPEREKSVGLIAAQLREIGIEAIPHVVPANEILADFEASTPDTPCALSRGNFDAAEVPATSSLEPLDYFFRYHGSQVSPNGANDASVVDALLDGALRTVQTAADFRIIRDAMAEFQRIYVEQAVEVPLYFRRSVVLVKPRLGNVAAGPTAAGPVWNVADWFVRR